MDAKIKDLWILIETKEDGTPGEVRLEPLSPGRKLASKQEGELMAVVIGYQTEASVQAVGEYGVDGIIVANSEEFKEYSTDTYTTALTFLIEKYEPTTMLIGATPTGRDLGPRLSCRLKAGLTTNCASLDVDAETGNMAWTRPTFGGNLVATILYPDCRPQLDAVRPGAFRRPEAGISRAGTIKEACSFPKEEIRTTVLEIIREVASEVVDLEGAEIIISGDHGLGGPDGFKLMRTLADVLGAAVGASRAVVDAGWISHSHQVGRAGEVVVPKVYITYDISDAIQHVTGMSGVDCIITVNKGPEAPIFGIADYGITGNSFKVVPVVTEEIRKAGV